MSSHQNFYLGTYLECIGKVDHWKTQERINEVLFYVHSECGCLPQDKDFWGVNAIKGDYKYFYFPDDGFIHEIDNPEQSIESFKKNYQEEFEILSSLYNKIEIKYGLIATWN